MTPDAAAGDSRLRPLPAHEWPAKMREAMAALTPSSPRHPLPSPDATRPKGLNALGTWAHHPELTRGYHALAGHVLFGTTLSLRQRELLILRVAALRDADYEWAQHVVLGLDAGLSRAEILAITRGAPGGTWSPIEQALLRAVDELVDDAKISAETWAVLDEHLDTQQILDVIFTVGTYDLLAMALRSAGTPLDDDLREWLNQHDF